MKECYTETKNRVHRLLCFHGIIYLNFNLFFAVNMSNKRNGSSVPNFTHYLQMETVDTEVF